MARSLHIGDVFKSGGKDYRVLAFEKAGNPYHDRLGRFASRGMSFLKSNYKETVEFVHGKSAKQVLTEVVKNHKVQNVAKDVVSMAISSILTYLHKKQFNEIHTEEFIQHMVHNLGTHLELSKEKSKAVLKDSVKALMDVRKRGKKEIEKSEDPVLEVLTMLSEMLDKGDDNEPQS
jgi:uncharacterized membrane protein YheB (UPF0754 family)